jgi:DNA-nicking Smr family endonuclease
MPKKNAIDNLTLQSLLMHSPFARLKGMVERRDLPASRPVHEESQRKEAKHLDPRPEEALFLEAMEGVKPIKREAVAGEAMERKPGERPKDNPEDEALSRLIRLVDYGEGFVVSDTPEYIEGLGYHVHRELARRLHQGEFSIQAHIDLHGLNVESAKEAFESFLKASIHSGKRAVLIIHGRGLSSRGEPVLKNKIREWLNQSYWLKRVMAYASAQSYDGGAGATYVLLRSRPVSTRGGKTRPGT